MSLLSNFFGKKKSATSRVGNAEDFSSLTRVYFQSVLAANLGITNINMVPDVAQFKRMFKIPTQGGKLGLAERSRSRKMLIEDYEMTDQFFKEIDASIKKNCKRQQDVQPYLYMYQDFSNSLMMLLGNLMQWQMRIPARFGKTLFAATEKTIHDIATKTVWKKDDVHKTAAQLRTYKERLGYSEAWMTEYAFHIILLAKKEARNRKKEQKSEAK
ncbi:MAG: hypothetical protein LBM61_00185 [Prevotellaceae bacterium]|jgi:hypothetical protein|nr:hypothetical protein [Prevotellaceae bacterium]